MGLALGTAIPSGADYLRIVSGFSLRRGKKGGELPHNHVMQDVFADRNVQVEVSEEAEGPLCDEPHR